MEPDLIDLLQRTLGASFRIERELGGGGMSRVFLATELTLARQVVIKVLPAELSAGASGERFRREIQLIARLQHPHIVPILSAGVADGALYYIMPFLPGESLRARLVREGPLAVPSVLAIVREILDALAFAHSHGVIHRDIKPENVLIGGGHAVVADFGVSKALRDSGALTSTGVSLGTPAYMAPEQAVADPATDHRADLYALAAVAYEMLTGAPPFTGTPSQVLKAHLTAPPAPLKQRRSDVPDAVADLVMRALRKDPSERPSSALDMLTALESAVVTPAEVRDPAAASSARRGDAWPGRWKPLRLAAAAVVALAATGIWIARFRTVIPSAQSLAITPFAVADGDTALVRLAQNLVTMLSANLDGVGELRVADAVAVLSHSRSRGALVSVDDAVDIARKLGARSAVHGTLARAGAQVRADLALYDVDARADAVARVSATVPLDSIAALTDSLTWRLLREVWSKGRSPTPEVASITTHNSVALREFLEGERLFARGGINQAAAAYKRAAEADTTFWFAHYRYLHARAWFSNPADPTIRSRLTRHLAELPERERLLLFAIDSSKSIRERQARLTALLVRFPDYTPALMHYGDYILHWAVLAGWDVREAIPSFRRLTELMPSDMTVLGHLGDACLTVGDLDCAQQVLARTDSVLNADSTLLEWTRSGALQLGYVLHRPSPNWADSLANVLRTARFQEPSGQGFVPTVSILPYTGALFAVYPDRLREQDRLYPRIAPDTARASDQAAPYYAGVRMLRAFSFLGRGNAAGLDTLRALASIMPPVVRAQIQPELQWARAAILLEMQGLRTPSAATAELVLSQPRRSAGDRADAHWIVGASALLRGDSALLRSQLAELARDSNAVAHRVARSLAALRMGFAGRRTEAAESLLVIERAQGERGQRAWGALAADRMYGARWLIESGRFAAADSLLRYTRAFPVPMDFMIVSQATFGIAQLLRSRIAEAQGRNAEAIAFAKIFLASFDQAPRSAQPMLEEARNRMVRLGGQFADPPTTTR